MGSVASAVAWVLSGLFKKAPAARPSPVSPGPVLRVGDVLREDDSTAVRVAGLDPLTLVVLQADSYPGWSNRLRVGQSVEMDQIDESMWSVADSSLPWYVVHRRPNGTFRFEHYR